MRIRDKLLSGFGLHIILVLIFGFFAYRELQAITMKLVLVETADDITNTLLEVRRYEKNYLLYGDQDNLREFTSYLALLRESIAHIQAEIISEIGAVNYDKMKRDIAEYEQLMNAVAGGLQTRDNVDRMRLIAREIQAFTQNLSRRERVDVAVTIKRSIYLLVIAIVISIVVGTAVIVKLAASIATPLGTLEKITKKIAEGDFSETIEVKGKDELASLELAFNHMEERLRDALRSLEATVKILQEKQAQLVEAEKLASVGILASGIAHEISNPLTSVLTFASLMLEQTPPDDPRADKLRMMVRETDRARIIVRQLLNFGKEVNVRPVRININRPVTEILDSLTAQGALKDIELVRHLSDGLPDAYVDPAQIGQVVLNIMLNAIHAITPPGTIEVLTRSEDRFVEIVFNDTGAGIQPEHLGKIFDPFFTTKDASRGTGLGLAVSYGIVKKHGGEITVASTVGQGSTFMVRLPIHA